MKAVSGDKVMSVSEVAEKLGISVFTVRAEMDRGKLGHLIMGTEKKRILRVTPTQFFDYVNSISRGGRHAEPRKTQPAAKVRRRKRKPLQKNELVDLG